MTQLPPDDGVSWLVILALVVGVALLGGIVVGWLRRRARREGDPSIPIVFPVQAPSAKPRQMPDRPRPSSAEPASPEPHTSPADVNLYEGRTIRFYRPPTKTLQLVPGRLEVVSGEEGREEIRFVRVPGAPVEVTLGRGEGAPLRHIQFKAPTVSRNHALMAYADSRWVITNHSQTNPVVVNGIELVPPRNQHVLTDGDEIEMGEVVFRFHER